MKFQKKPLHEKRSYLLFSYYFHQVREKQDLLESLEKSSYSPNTRATLARDISSYLSSFQRDKKRIESNPELNLRDLDEEHEKLKMRYERLFKARI